MERIGGFKILSVLGQGGMGRVYLAEDEQLHRKVAIKAVLGTSEVDRKRLLREGRIAASLNHPGICTIHQLVEMGDDLFVVMECVEGVTLKDAIPSGGFDPLTTINYGLQLADALAFAHRARVVHRDLKSNNVMVSPDGRLKILDFGLARQNAMLRPDDATADVATVTSSTDIMGTVHYMAPELLRGESADAVSDVWALGIVFYEMIAGKRPFDAPTSFALSSQILSGQAQPLPDSVPPDLAIVIHRCLQKQPAHRYRDSGEVRAALERLRVPITESVEVAPAPSGRPAFNSLAVLPLRNLSGDPAQDFFLDGLTEALITDLGKIKALKVISRTSVMLHKNSDRPVSEIARILNVSAAVEGSALRIGDQIRVSAQLVDASSDTIVWAQRYTRKVDDVFALQEELADAIAREVQVNITPQERENLSAVSAVPLEVYEAYLKGRFFWNMRTADGFSKAAEWFQKAMALDATYPLPHAVMGDTMLLLGVYGFRRPKDVFPPAIRMIQRAIELDDRVAEAHSSLGWALQLFNLDRPGAEREYSRALALNPGHVPTHLRFGAYLMGIRRTGEGLDMLRRGVDLDPLSMIMRALLAYGYYLARDYPRAVEFSQASLDLDPNFWWTHWSLAETYRAMDRSDQAITHLERAAVLSPANSFIEGPLSAAYAASARLDDARRVPEAMTPPATTQYVSPYFIGLAEMGLGNKDRAFALLSDAVDERDSWISFCAVNPALDALRDDPRLADISKRMNVDW